MLNSPVRIRVSNQKFKTKKYIYIYIYQFFLTVCVDNRYLAAYQASSCSIRLCRMAAVALSLRLNFLLFYFSFLLSYLYYFFPAKKSMLID